MTEIHMGHVRQFNDDGWGSINGHAEVIDFHCTALADGSRHIAAGTRVAYQRSAGLAGRWEATAVTPV